MRCATADSDRAPTFALDDFRLCATACRRLVAALRGLLQLLHHRWRIVKKDRHDLDGGVADHRVQFVQHIAVEYRLWLGAHSAVIVLQSRAMLG